MIQQGAEPEIGLMLLLLVAIIVFSALWLWRLFDHQLKEEELDNSVPYGLHFWNTWPDGVLTVLMSSKGPWHPEGIATRAVLQLLTAEELWQLGSLNTLTITGEAHRNPRMMKILNELQKQGGVV